MLILTKTLHNSNRIEFDYDNGEKLKLKLTNVWKKQEAFVEFNTKELRELINVCEMRLEDMEKAQQEAEENREDEEE